MTEREGEREKKKKKGTEEKKKEKTWYPEREHAK